VDREVTAQGHLTAAQAPTNGLSVQTWALRIVLATYALAAPGGSESYLMTVAHQLQRLGHEITVFAEDLGPFAELVEREGLRVTNRPWELPADCDAVLTRVTGGLEAFPPVLARRIAGERDVEPDRRRAGT